MKYSMFISALSFAGLMMSSTTPAHAGDGEITLIHTGDFHGHLISRPNVRTDSTGLVEGGLARVYTKIKGIRAAQKNTLLINTGDTIQGSAEVLYTRGQAIVDVLNSFAFDAFAPGNWEYVYGTSRFLELFAGSATAAPIAPWKSLAANLYYSTLTEDPTTPFPNKAGQRVLPPYLIKTVGGIKVGIMGFTTDRGPTVVGSTVTKGFTFTKGDAEVPALIAQLRDVEQVDLIVMASELGLANNIRLAEANPGIHVILSSDMHEETTKPVVTSTGTIIIEEGQDGTMLGELKLKIINRQVASWTHQAHTITSAIAEDKTIAGKVNTARATFVSGRNFVQHVNPINGSKLKRPIDTIVGYTAKPLHRSNYSHETMPAVIEGSSHDFLTDAFRSMTGANVGAIRGFRYGTHVKTGAIKMEDLYHFMPIGAQIAVGTITGSQIKNQIENAANGSLDPNVANWTGGWLFNFSGLTMNLDPYLASGSRASNILINGAALNTAAAYTYASYWYAGDPTLINTLAATNINVLKEADGSPMDGTEVVVQYLQSLPNRTADTQLNRITLLKALPGARFGFSEIQPLRGAQ